MLESPALRPGSPDHIAWFSDLLDSVAARGACLRVEVDPRSDSARVGRRSHRERARSRVDVNFVRGSADCVRDPDEVVRQVVGPASQVGTTNDQRGRRGRKVRRGDWGRARVVGLESRNSRLNGLRVGSTGRLGTRPGYSTESEDDDRGQDAEDDDDDEKFNKGEPIFSLASGLLPLDLTIPLYHFVAFR
jgi:hypothetical protein